MSGHPSPLSCSEISGPLSKNSDENPRMRQFKIPTKSACMCGLSSFLDNGPELPVSGSQKQDWTISYHLYMVWLVSLDHTHYCQLTRDLQRSISGAKVNIRCKGQYQVVAERGNGHAMSDLAVKN